MLPGLFMSTGTGRFADARESSIPGSELTSAVLLPEGNEEASESCLGDNGRDTSLSSIGTEATPGSPEFSNEIPMPMPPLLPPFLFL